MNFNIFGGFQKNEYFFGMKILWLFFWGHYKIKGLFLRSMYIMEMFFRVAKVSNIIGVLEIPDTFWE